MASPTGSLIGLTAAQLQTIIANAQGCIVANTVRGSSYTIAGRSFTFPSLDEAGRMLGEANYALGLLTGQRSLNVRGNFNRAIDRAYQNG
jgi:hypothetical protein